MKSVWVLDLVDLKRSTIKVSNKDLAIAKIFSVPYLSNVKFYFNTLLAICKDCAWVIDIESGVRHRVGGSY